ncbi:MAG: 50S ribosomal protein L23 [Phycisphaerae bacterium]|nr:50S ribosomal protein L23 [Phycisphaerae bacterium]
MEPTQIIVKPLVTEKSNWESEARNRYSFEVHRAANKHQIRDAIQTIYKVRVTSVATAKRLGKYRKTRFGPCRTKNWKRAVVQLHPDDRIELF